MVRPDNYVRGLTVTGLGVLALSPDGLLTQMIDTDPWTMMFWRGLLMGLALFAFTGLRHGVHAGRRIRAIGWPGLQVAVLFALGTAMFVTSIRSATIANTLFIFATAPLFAAAFSHLFLRERVAGRTWIAALAVLVGMAVIFADNLVAGNPLGNLAGIVGAVAWGANLVVLRKARLTDPTPAMALGGLLLAAVALAVAPTLVIEGRDIVLMGLLGLVILPLSFALISHGPSFIPAPEAGLIMLLEGILGPLWAWLVIAELPSGAAFVGGAIVLGTLAVHSGLALWRRPALAAAR